TGKKAEKWATRGFGFVRRRSFPLFPSLYLTFSFPFVYFAVTGKEPTTLSPRATETGKAT
ncbi:hypothetical protein LY76DRAFT_591575, partial [Colletotrichum caudatum]